MNVVLDMVGGDYFANHVRVLVMDGRLVHIATTAGNKVELDLRALMAKRLIVPGPTLQQNQSCCIPKPRHSSRRDHQGARP